MIAGEKKCEKCKKDKQGCYWGGVTKDGVHRPEKERAKVEKAETPSESSFCTESQASTDVSA